MAAMLLSGQSTFLLLCLSLYVAGGPAPSAQDPADKPKDKAAPAIRVAVTQLKPDATIDLGGTRGFGSGDGSVWVSLKESGTVVRIDPKTNKTTQTITLGKPPCGGVTSGLGGVWVPLCGTAGVARIDSKDPKANAVTTTVTKGLTRVSGRVVTGVESVWVISDEHGTIARIDPATNTVIAEVYTGSAASGLAFDQDQLWVISATTNQIAKISAHTNLLAETINVGKAPVGVASGEGSIWTLNAGDATVSRVDPRINKVAETIKLGAPITGGQIAVGEGSVWVSAPGLPLLRIDPRTNQVAQVFTGLGGGQVLVAEGAVWITADAKTIWRLDPKRIEATR